MSPKAAIARRPYPPGMHGKSSRRSVSEYGEQLRAKQKIRWSYGLTERQLKRLVKDAIRRTAVTGPQIIEILERRLDNVVYRLGFAPSRFAARQLVVHGHIVVNGRKVTVPSYSVRVGDIITIRPESRPKKLFAGLSEEVKKVQLPPWLALDHKTLEGKVIALPSAYGDAQSFPFDIGAVVEFYSK